MVSELMPMGQEASASNSVMTTIVGGRDKIMYALLSIPECLKFNGTNLYQWEKFVELTLLGRGLSEHLINDPIGMNDSNYKLWKSEQAFIHSWLLGTMIVEMCDNFLYMTTVKEL
ncbi:unnamed protein product [Spirodela intermedia]|uniref:Uncharacterized protein n=1 Tax=Spirodela intermedia TaxID=51605 RepID=A0A7I8KJ63_SPIIN|nr:unnamed protein product [Spirodela intermedia]